MDCPLCNISMTKQGRFEYTCPICGYSEWDDSDDDDDD